MNKRKAYEEKLDAQLREWRSKIENLKAKADKADAEAKIEYYRNIDSLKNDYNALQAKLLQLKSAADESWEDIKAGSETAWEELKTAFSNAMAKFKD
ncbi:MAG: coiled coil domain-containing protein [Candidatus Kuenenia sp.]|nr:coiled coil domain-containing protein [Candidatus Kuenenia hertensis]